VLKFPLSPEQGTVYFPERRTCVRKLVLLLLVLGLLGIPRLAQATIGTIDNVPAATLLVPYFEVDLDNDNGVTTLFSINNASATAVLAHVTVWSDLSVHVFDFMVYLTGYDVVTLNLRDIIVNGVVPTTASAGQDPADAISPHGPISQDINFASCSGFFPLPAVPAVLVQHMQDALTGQFSSVLGGCAAQDFGDRIARGYVTVNTVNQCTVSWPGQDPAYFLPGGSGIATNQNVLWGDYFYVNPSENFAQGDALVHIEASATNPETSVAGQYTFWGRYVAWTAADNREPLSTNFATRYVAGGAFNGGTDLLVWRDSKIVQNAFTCPVVAGVRPVWYPLSQEQIVIFDEEENPFQVDTSPFSPALPGIELLPFPAEANRTHVGGPNLPAPFEFGWLYLNLNSVVVAAGLVPPEDPVAAQAWVTTVMDAEGRFSVGYAATQLDSATNASHVILPVP